MSEELLSVPALHDYTIRAPELSDASTASELHNICSMLVSGKKETEPVDFENGWQAPDFDKDASVQLVFTQEGQLAANFHVRDHIAPYIYIGLGITVHPDHRENGMPEAMLAWAEAHARKSVSKAPEGTQVVVRTGADNQDKYKIGLLEGFGMELIRHFYEMTIEFEQDPIQPVIPDGLIIRPYRQEEELEGVALAYQDSFKDHFGFVEEPIEKLMEGVRYMIEKDPHYDADVWFVAMDGDEIAGVSLCVPKVTEDPKMGYVNVLGVRRQWRGRGLGLALLQYSFVELHKRGAKRVGLGVDASSLTGATRLYQKAGMSVTRQFDAYRKILREGEDITTTSL